MYHNSYSFSRFVSSDRLFNQYLRDMRKRNSPTLIEEKELIRLAQQGDPIAKQQLAKANSRLIISQAKNYMHLGLPLMDLIQAGNIGLMKAIQKFEPNYNFKLTTYASYWILESIRQALARDSRLVRLPKSQIQNANKLKRLETKLEKELGRKPSEEEIAEQTTSLSPRQVQLIKFFTRKSETISLSAPVSEESELCWGDCLELPDALSPLEAICQRELYRRLNESLLILTERERLVLVMVFGLNQEKSYTLAKIGKSLGISRERARQIKEKALEKLKKYLDPSSWQEA